MRYEGQTIRTIALLPAGAKTVHVDPADEREHFEAWKTGRELEERIRRQVDAKRKRAQIETETMDPAVYDLLFAVTMEEPVSQEVTV